METIDIILSVFAVSGVLYSIYMTVRNLSYMTIRKIFKLGCDHRFDMETIRDLNFEPKCKKCGKYVSGIVGQKIYRTNQYKFVFVKEDEYKIKIK